MEPQEEGSHDPWGLEGSSTAGLGDAQSFAELFEVMVFPVSDIR